MKSRKKTGKNRNIKNYVFPNIFYEKIIIKNCTRKVKYHQILYELVGNDIWFGCSRLKNEQIAFGR